MANCGCPLGYPREVGGFIRHTGNCRRSDECRNCANLHAENEALVGFAAYIRQRTETLAWRCPRCGGDLVMGDSRERLWHCENARVGTEDWEGHFEVSRRYGDRPSQVFREMHDEAHALLDQEAPHE